jgi:5,10-methenyltetrahydromethanopterin hydrogenase
MGQSVHCNPSGAPYGGRSIAALFNYMDRMADALGAPVEGFQAMMAKMAGE